MIVTYSLSVTLDGHSLMVNIHFGAKEQTQTSRRHLYIFVSFSIALHPVHFSILLRHQNAPNQIGPRYQGFTNLWRKISELETT